jgi:hypothetical protein
MRTTSRRRQTVPRVWGLLAAALVLTMAWWTPRVATATASEGSRKGEPRRVAAALDEGQVEPNWDNWHLGDVHVHAAGDISLLHHPGCLEFALESELTHERKCADKMVDRVVQSARQHELEWLILSEHAPWLGSGEPRIGMRLTYDHAQALSQWTFLRAAAERESLGAGVRMLMGQELGTFGLGDVPANRAGHFSAYFVPTLAPNGLTDRTEVQYIRKVEALGGWGAINHPDEGSTWDCWYENEPPGSCGQGGAADHADGLQAPNPQAGFRALELSSDRSLAKQSTVDRWDELLRYGLKVAAVGGSDAHSERTSLGDPPPIKPGNLEKLGLASRTYLYHQGSLAPNNEYRSTVADDPVREAIKAGRTVASNGPLVVATVDGRGPGETVDLKAGEPLGLQISWRQRFRVDNAAACRPPDDSGSVPTDPFECNRAPDSVRVMFAPRDRGRLCQTDLPTDCVDLTYPLSAADKQRGYIDASHLGSDRLKLPEFVNDAYLRVEARYNDLNPSDGRNSEYGAFPSPVFIHQAPGAVEKLDGCNAHTLPANDDSSSDAHQLPFPANFFGTTYTHAYVNNNGNVTFDAPQSEYTPFRLTAQTPPIIAPFFADVDTRAGTSKLVTWGPVTWSGRPAFCVNWVDVGYYHQHGEKLNSFQLLLVDQSTAGTGDFDIVFNYNRVLWETGDASGGSGGLGGTPAGAGYSSGSNGAVPAAGFFEFPGSLEHAALLDENPAGLANTSTNSVMAGRHIFAVRNGAPPTGGVVAGSVLDTASPAHAVASAPVQVCPSTGGRCVFVTMTDDAGRFAATGLPGGTYDLRALPPRGSSLGPGETRGVVLPEGGAVAADVRLTGPQSPSDDVTVGAARTGVDGIPSVYLDIPFPITVSTCPGGQATYEVSAGDLAVRGATPMQETGGGGGSYQATVDPLGRTGLVHFTVRIDCPGSIADQVREFDVYIDPSGLVRTLGGAPVAGATVTIYRADTPMGPFAAVPDGDAVLSPSNRSNPDTTDAAGRFGWDVIAGYYFVRVTAPGCTAPTDPDQPYVDSQVLTVPPPHTDLDLRLRCNEPPSAQAVDATTTQDHPVPVSLTATDPDGGQLTYAVVQLPEHGTLQGTAPNLVYVPAAGYVGQDRFGWEVTDPEGATVTGEARLTVQPAGPRCTIVGTSHDDVLRGTPGTDTICGGRGDDLVVGMGGNDRLLGGGGRDRLKGGLGNDVLDGGGGNDRLLGGGGRDRLKGNAGTDELRGAEGDDLLNGGSGQDFCHGGPQRDVATQCERLLGIP